MKNNVTSPDPDIINRLGILKEMPERSSAAAEQGRARFLAQARSMRASISEPASWVERFRSFLNSLAPRPALNWAVAVVIALVMVFGGTSTTVRASQASLPGDPLYSLKLLSENSRLFWTFSAEAKVNLTLELADRRVTEISQLQSQGRPVPQQVIDRLMGELNQGLALASGMKDPQMQQSLKLVSDRVEKQLKIVDALLAGKTPPAALANVQGLLAQVETNANMGQSDPQAFRIYEQTKAAQVGKPTDTSTTTPTLTSTGTFTSTNTTTPTKTHKPSLTLSQTPTITLTPTASITTTPDETPTTKVKVNPTPTPSRPVHTRKPTHTPRTKPNGLY